MNGSLLNAVRASITSDIMILFPMNIALREIISKAFTNSIIEWISFFFRSDSNHWQPSKRTRAITSFSWLFVWKRNQCIAIVQFSKQQTFTSFGCCVFQRISLSAFVSASMSWDIVFDNISNWYCRGLLIQRLNFRASRAFCIIRNVSTALARMLI